ncbi:A/G-specific adenine glycosylase [Candidatus Saccharibacteria bacterium]|nr:A/G-specific adenine glycosylase [Candidatus Saccharibacteria bacterium]
MQSADQKLFLETLWNYYAANGRDLPWRHAEPDGRFDAYKIMVSEFMLQQTQVSRVIPKYQQFLEAFPTVIDLAQAALVDVLRAWNGLGYNRRAKFIHEAAKAIAKLHGGSVPLDIEQLKLLPGIGHNTAAAILAYADNQAVVFVETNIRTVYIHHFFPEANDVTDAEILGRLNETLDREHPREFYWALMDYGSHLKATQGNSARRSKSYSKQSVFAGSKRQVRGQVIRELLEKPQPITRLQSAIPDERLSSVIDDLCSEGIVILEKQQYRLA